MENQNSADLKIQENSKNDETMIQEISQQSTVSASEPEPIITDDVNNL